MKFGHVIFSSFVDFLFPISCVGCREKDVFLCPECFNSIKFIEIRECPYCRTPNKTGRKCLKCEGPIDALFVACKYEKDGVLKRVIESFKYKFNKEFETVLGSILYTQSQKLFNFFTQLPVSVADVSLVPVPLHQKRLNERGYNQSDLICCKFVSKSCTYTKRSQILIRQKNTPPQAKLNKSERFDNVKSAFKCVHPDLVKNKNFVLVDDVCTTLSTLNECAIELKKNGALKVCGLVLARGDFH